VDELARSGILKKSTPVQFCLQSKPDLNGTGAVSMGTRRYISGASRHDLGMSSEPSVHVLDNHLHAVTSIQLLDPL
jgi:hypothetical protein